MNNIEILEEYKKLMEDLYRFIDDDMGGHFEPVVGNQKANTMLGYLAFERKLENLIQENKELKKENEKLTYARNWYFEHFTTQACTPEQLHKILRFDYIPKSKVKAMLEGITKEHSSILSKDIYSLNDKNIATFQYNAMRKILEELLEEGDK